MLLTYARKHKQADAALQQAAFPQPIVTQGTEQVGQEPRLPSERGRRTKAGGANTTIRALWLSK